MANEEFADARGVRFSPTRDDTITALSEDYRLDRSEIIRRMVEFAVVNASQEDLFSEEIAADRERARELAVIDSEA